MFILVAVVYTGPIAKYAAVPVSFDKSVPETQISSPTSSTPPLQVQQQGPRSKRRSGLATERETGTT
ncbi:hypothetical protein OFB78_28850, partial [Escherichia coli]|nr:hypothetical protein [Escherichia coli]